MNTHLPTVSIGIPAYNEAANIRHLLESLLVQQRVGFVLKEIIVVSDGSTDSTVTLARSVDSPLIRVIDRDMRRGQQTRQNELLALYRSDILVIIEADTLLASERTLAELVQPLCNDSTGRVGMTVGAAIPVAPQTFYENILWHASELKKLIFAHWRGGDNVYRCGGHAMKGLSRIFAQQLFWPEDVSEDAYVYLRLKQLSLSCIYCPSALVYMRNVTNISDRVKQVAKFLGGRIALERHFARDVVQAAYRLPYSLVSQHVLRSLLRDPFWTTLAVLEISFNRLLTLRRAPFHPLAAPHYSSKDLRHAFVRRHPALLETITIGIPVYNEEQNIQQLLEALRAQQLTTARIDEIIVVSDGSTDGTVACVRSVHDPRIRLIEVQQREGIAATQNKIVAAARGDVLVMLDGDVLPSNAHFLEEVIRPLQHDERVGLVGADVISAQPQNFFESIIAYSHDLKRAIYQEIRDGNNVYLCHGRARAFSRTLYERLRWPELYSEDAYSYFICVRVGLRFVFAPAAQVVFRSPQTFTDYARQSTRFFVGRQQVAQHFGSDFVSEQFYIPYPVLLRVLPSSLVRRPILTISYLSIILYLRLYRHLIPTNGGEYKIAVSSKKIVV